MGGGFGAGSILARKLPFYLLIKAILTMIVLVYAASVSVTVTVHQADVGGYLSVTNNLAAMDKGFSKASSTLTVTGNCPTGNVTFSSSPQVANTNITLSHIIYDIQVNTTATTALLSCFAVMLTITPAGSSQQTSTVKVATGSSVSAGWTVDCKFDIGTTLPPSPFSFKVTVA